MRICDAKESNMIENLQKFAEDDYRQFVASMSQDIANDKICELIQSPAIRIETQQRLMAIAVWAHDRGDRSAIPASNEMCKLISLMGVEPNGNRFALPKCQPQKPVAP